jgi:hypothetical protein
LSKCSKNSRKSDSDCECRCVETLAEQLKKNIGDLVIIYERDEGGNNAIGNIVEVIDDSVVVLENAQKANCFCGSTTFAGFIRLYISICEITEFGIVTDVPPSIASTDCCSERNVIGQNKLEM